MGNYTAPITSAPYWNAVYGGALDYLEMKKHYIRLQKVAYPQNYFSCLLPYSPEMVFFKGSKWNSYYVDYEQVTAKYSATHDVDPHPDQTGDFFVSGFMDDVRNSFAISNRRWDESVNNPLLRIGEIDREKREIEFGRTTYNWQVLTNLSMDLRRTSSDASTLRERTRVRDGPPPLQDRNRRVRLANNLGISVLLSCEDRLLVPLRSHDVAVFPNEWGCAPSFAARWVPSMQGFSGSFSKIVSGLVNDHLKLELAMFPNFIDNLIPLALTREWFRGGKTQLFMLATSKMSTKQIIAKLPKAEHENEISAKWRSAPVLKYIPGKKYVMMNEKNRNKYTPSVEYMMNYILARHFIEAQNQVA
ncbi:MAG: hypothetical protein HYY22_02055 [Thaumarchaeota archaeon]|nr:hypothetical protein [Nitrososphaerota archaeon]